MAMPDLGQFHRSLNSLIGGQEMPMIPGPAPESLQVPETMLTLNLQAVIHRHMHFVLDRNRGNKLKTARQLGISRSTLYRMLDEEIAAAE